MACVEFSGEFFLHPSALVEDTATGVHSPHGGHVAQQANQSILRDGCVMQAERFVLQPLSEELEGLWGCSAEQTWRRTSLEKDEIYCQTLSSWIQLCLKTIPSSTSHSVDVLWV